jgi:hypothetical protein
MNNATTFDEENDTTTGSCPVVGYQDVSVCVPVTVKPYAEVGDTKTQCMGDAVITHGTNACADDKGDYCQFTISQVLRIEVPVVFGATAETGTPAVDCDTDTEDEYSTDVIPPCTCSNK